jgi:MFS superfamily sulfate permease-like transporter
MTDGRTVAPPAGGRTWQADFLASLVVFMVALPLCIGIAQACGLPPEAGLVTGIVGGILIGSLSGSPLQVSGPAAGLIVLVIEFLDQAKAPHLAAGLSEADALARAVPLFGLAILLAGAIQIVAGVFRVGQWFRAVSPAVVEGMLAGIGATIIAKQFHVMVDDAPPKDVVEGLLTIPQAVWKGFVPPEGAAANHREAALIGLVTIVILVGWRAVVPKQLKIIPAAVVAIVAAVLVNEFGRPVFELLGVPVGPAVDEYGGLGVAKVEVSADLLGSLTLLPAHWPGWGALGSRVVWMAAVTFALIASAETLLCATAVDTMHRGPRTRYDRELVAQGVGNMVCGFVGALPMTGVIVRSSANVAAGARTRLSTILHGVWLLLFVSLLPGVLSRIPTAALAAVLVYTGWRLINLPGVVHLWKMSRGEAFIYAATAIMIVATDLLAGVVTGFVLSAARLLWLFSHLDIRREDEPEHHRVHLHLAGAGTFLRLPQLAEALDAVPRGSKLHVHMERLQLVDHAALTLLMTFQKQFEATGGRLYLDWDRLMTHFRAPRLGNGEEAVPNPGPPTQDGTGAIGEHRPGTSPTAADQVKR